MANYDDNTLMDITEFKGLQSFDDFDDMTLSNDDDLDSYLKSIDNGFFSNEF